MKNLFLVAIIFLTFTYNIFAWFDGARLWASGQGVGLDPNKTWIGDFNGDGMDDKLQLYGSGDWWVALSNGTSFSGDSRWATNHDNGATKYYIGDFNGDGMDDILSYRSSGGIWKLSLCQQSLTNGKYSFATPITVATNKYISITYNWVGDFNGDGIEEILYYEGGLRIFRTTGYWNIQYGWSPSFSFTNCYTGDLNGDGYDDFIIYRNTDAVYGNNCWLVALSIPGQNKFNFNPIVKWTSGQGLNSSGHFICDLNGDGKADKLNFYSSTGEWWVAFSDGNSFSSPEVRWTSGQGIGVSGVYIGDFNGDNQNDIVSYLSWNGQWWVGLNLKPQQKTIATWFTAWYCEGCNLNINKRDPQKTPIVGLGDTITGLYNSTDPTIINKQIDAMIEVGINLLIVDITNGWNSDATVMATTDSLFSIMSRRSINNRVKIAIGLGKEFWGPREFSYINWTWEGWAQQYQNQINALNEIYNKYANHQIYKDIYFNYLNRPLVIAYLASSLDYQDNNGNVIILKKYNNFTIKPAINWAKTYPGYAWIEDESRWIYINGQSSKRFWGWGAEYSQPYNKEQVSVMPGTYIWWDDNPRELIPRYGGNYYIDSWKRVIEINPNLVIIADWNNWNEDTAIEGCIGNNGWKDYYNVSTYDWYLQITKSYSIIFKTNTIPSGTYIRDDNEPEVYLWNGSSLIYQGVFPHNKPIISLPSGWLQSHGYYLQKSTVKDNIKNLPFEFGIEQNYPNPFNPSTSIKYSIKEEVLVSIKVFNILGEEITTLVNEIKEPGIYEINFNASNLPTGIYIYKIQAGTFNESKKMLCIK